MIFRKENDLLQGQLKIKSEIIARFEAEQKKNLRKIRLGEEAEGKISKFE